MVKKRREEAKKMVYQKMYIQDSADEEIRLDMKEIRHFTSLSTIILEFYAYIQLITHILIIDLQVQYH